MNNFRLERKEMNCPNDYSVLVLDQEGICSNRYLCPKCNFRLSDDLEWIPLGPLIRYLNFDPCDLIRRIKTGAY